MANPTIVNYIVSELEKNVPKEDIARTLLTEGGWKEKEIADAFAAIGIADTGLSLTARLTTTTKHILAYAALFTVIGTIVVALTWYGITVFRTPERLVEKTLLKFFQAESLSLVVVSHVEITAPSAAFNPLFNPFAAAPSSSGREVLNGNVRLSADLSMKEMEHPKTNGTFRVDLVSSRFPAQDRISGEALFIVDSPLLHVSLPFETAQAILPAFIWETREADKESVVSSFDLARALGVSRLGLTAEERHAIVNLYEEHAPLELKDGGSAMVGNENLRRITYVVNPYSLKFIVQDFSERFPNTFSEGQAKVLQQIIDSLEFAPGEILVAERGLELRRMEVEVLFKAENPYNYSGSIASLLTFKDFGREFSFDAPQDSLLVRFQDIWQ